MRRAWLGLAMLVAACGGSDAPTRVLSGAPGPIPVITAPGIAAIVQPVDGVPPVVSQAIAEATARALGLRAEADDMFAAQRVFTLRGAIVHPPLSDPELLSVDWWVMDRRDTALGGFLAEIALPPGDAADRLKRIGPSEIGQIGGETARLFFTLAAVDRAIAEAATP